METKGYSKKRNKLTQKFARLKLMMELRMHGRLECQLRHGKILSGAFPSGKSGEDIATGLLMW